MTPRERHSPLRIFLAGEGTNDIGSYAKERPYHDARDTGVVGALLQKVVDRVGANAWEIVGGVAWKHLRKMKVGARGEGANVAAAAFHARDREHAADVLVFVRDTDGDLNRRAALEAGLAKEDFGVVVVGGLADPCLEAWILALHGERGVERARQGYVERRAEALGLPAKETRAYVDAVEACTLTDIPEDAKDLRRWISDLEGVLRD
jgi:ferritin-like protein